MSVSRDSATLAGPDGETVTLRLVGASGGGAD